MKKDVFPEMNKKYNTIAAYTLAVSAVIVLFIMLLVFIIPVSGFVKKLFGILSPFFYGFAFAYILCPVCNFFDSKINKLLEKKKAGFLKKHGGLVITYVLFLLFLTLFFYIIIPQLISSFNTFASSYKNYGRQISVFFSELPERFKFISPEILRRAQDVITEALNSTAELITKYSPVIIARISGFAMVLWKVILGFIISVYMLSGRKTFVRQTKKLLYAFLSESRADAVITRAKDVHGLFGGFVNGKLLDSLIIGVLCFAGMSLLRIPYTPLVSVIVGVTNVIPYFGPFLGAIPSFVIIFFTSPLKALWFIIFILVLQQIDGNIIGPKILKQTIGIYSFWVIFPLIVMGRLFRVPGMVLAVPLFALLYTETARAVNQRLAEKAQNKKTIKSAAEAVSDAPFEAAEKPSDDEN